MLRDCVRCSRALKTVRTDSQKFGWDGLEGHGEFYRSNDEANIYNLGKFSMGNHMDDERFPSEISSFEE